MKLHRLSQVPFNFRELETEMRSMFRENASVNKRQKFDTTPIPSRVTSPWNKHGRPSHD